MLFPLQVLCPACRFGSTAITNATQKYPKHTCPQCGVSLTIMDSITFSLIADRLLIRADSEIDKGDYTVAIILSAMAVETAVTQVFMKWKGIEHYGKTGSLNPTEAEEEAWEAEYFQATTKFQPGLRAFEKEANFVSLFLVANKYDDFVFGKATATTQPNLLSAKQIHIDLFDKRNRVMHWGEVEYGREDALTALVAAKQAIATLRTMDFEKWQAEENERRASLAAVEVRPSA
jgi:hypothetical protein